VFGAVGWARSRVPYREVSQYIKPVFPVFSSFVYMRGYRYLRFEAEDGLCVVRQGRNGHNLPHALAQLQTRIAPHRTERAPSLHGVHVEECISGTPRRFMFVALSPIPHSALLLRSSCSVWHGCCRWVAHRHRATPVPRHHVVLGVFRVDGPAQGPRHPLHISPIPIYPPALEIPLGGEGGGTGKGRLVLYQ
jgi:hypothetical protein